MLDLNCPNCGTTQSSVNPGPCDCCGFEISKEYIDDFLEKQRKQEEAQKKRLAEIERKKRAQIEKMERERLERKKKLEQAHREAVKKAEEERKAREKLREILDKEKIRIEKEYKFSVAFKKFRKLISNTGVVLVFVLFAVSVFKVVEGNTQFLQINNNIPQKISQIYEDVTLQVKINDETGLLEQDTSSESQRLTKSTVKFINSVSSLIQNRSTIDEKLTFFHIDTEDSEGTTQVEDSELSE